MAFFVIDLNDQFYILKHEATYEFLVVKNPYLVIVAKTYYHN